MSRRGRVKVNIRDGMRERDCATGILDISSHLPGECGVGEVSRGREKLVVGV